MAYNLLTKQWIPVRDDAGHTWNIAPHEMTREHPEYRSLPVALAAPRPDFNGALIQFLIGLVQTACPPKTERAWRQWFKNPPEAEVLEDAFGRFEHAFNLDGDGPRFMQDYDFVRTGVRYDSVEDYDRFPISYLLIDSDTTTPRKSKSISHAERFDITNKEHFNKGRYGWQLSPAAAAMALLSGQLYTPGVGSGYRGSIRGIGALSTVVLGHNLWQTAWINTLTQAEFQGLCGKRSTDLSDLFPWVEATPTSEDDHLHTPEEVNASHLYWAMPQRVVLFKGSGGRCSLVPGHEGERYGTYYKQNRGIDYDSKSSWHHPLSPMVLKDKWKPVKVEDDIHSYRGWSGLATSGHGKKTRAALVVGKFQQRGSYQSVHAAFFGDDAVTTSQARPRIWAFGYQLDSAKAEAYHEATMPLFVVPPANRIEFETLVHDLIRAAEHAVNEGNPGLRHALARALFGSFHQKPGEARPAWHFPTSAKGGARGENPKVAAAKSTVADTSTRFWKETEDDFYRLLGTAEEQLREGGENPDLKPLRERWWCIVKQNTLRLYDEVTQYGDFDRLDPRAVTRARLELRWTLDSTCRHKLDLSS